MPRTYVLMIFLMIKWIYTLWVFESRVLQCLHDQMIRYQIEVMAPSIVFKITPKALKLNSLRFLNFSFYLLDPFKKNQLNRTYSSHYDGIMKNCSIHLQSVPWWNSEYKSIRKTWYTNDIYLKLTPNLSFDITNTLRKKNSKNFIDLIVFYCYQLFSNNRSVRR